MSLKNSHQCHYCKQHAHNKVLVSTHPSMWYCRDARTCQARIDTAHIQRPDTPSTDDAMITKLARVLNTAVTIPFGSQYEMARWIGTEMMGYEETFKRVKNCHI